MKARRKGCYERSRKEKLEVAVSELRAKGYDVTGVVAHNKKLDDVKKTARSCNLKRWGIAL